ncbi:MAG: hypothetical protein IKN10_01750 [Muribaculaceae bacterium]|nr:hypothetical protein [Muribaculaceae bacterium]
MKKLLYILLVALLAGCIKVNEVPLAEEDSALVSLLNELDKCQESGDHEKRFKLYSQIAAEYEKKNLTDLQKQYQQKMLSEAEAISTINNVYGHRLMAEALQQLATAHMVEGSLDSASIEAHQAYQLAPKDTLDFRAQTLLLLAQIQLMAEEGDSVEHYISEAKRIYPKVVQTDLYRITHAYGLNLQNRNEDLMAVLPSYISECGIHGQAELTRLLMNQHEEANQWQNAYDDAINLMDITDSIARSETSENMARIHELQHERQMEFQRAERKAEQARLYVIIIAVLLLLLAAAVAGLFYRRKARIAYDKELEAMRLSEAAQANENLVREENIKLQRLYYEHLYAIILPILNAHRGKNGHINLEESSWELIEKNTDIVLPGFTSRLRRQHPTLTTEDVRFCCLLMMRVPNALLADVYGIAPSSVAVRKQRMKKKLDSDIENQTIENYLNQYIK